MHEGNAEQTPYKPPQSITVREAIAVLEPQVKFEGIDCQEVITRVLDGGRPMETLDMRHLNMSNDLKTIIQVRNPEFVDSLPVTRPLTPDGKLIPGTYFQQEKTQAQIDEWLERNEAKFSGISVEAGDLGLALRSRRAIPNVGEKARQAGF